MSAKGRRPKNLHSQRTCPLGGGQNPCTLRKFKLFFCREEKFQKIYKKKPPKICIQEKKQTCPLLESKFLLDGSLVCFTCFHILVNIVLLHILWYTYRPKKLNCNFFVIDTVSSCQPTRLSPVERRCGPAQRSSSRSSLRSQRVKLVSIQTFLFQPIRSGLFQVIFFFTVKKCKKSGTREKLSWDPLQL